MRIAQVEIINFKRFTNLTISGISDKAKLVLLIGPDGSGKSALFDAFDFMAKGTLKSIPFRSLEDADSYYKKTSVHHVTFAFNSLLVI